MNIFSNATDSELGLDESEAELEALTESDEEEATTAQQTWPFKDVPFPDDLRFALDKQQYSKDLRQWFASRLAEVDEAESTLNDGSRQK